MQAVLYFWKIYSKRYITYASRVIFKKKYILNVISLMQAVLYLKNIYSKRYITYASRVIFLKNIF